MASNDQNDPKKPRYILTITRGRVKEGPGNKEVFELKSGVGSSFLGNTVHLYESQSHTGSRKQQLADRLTLEFEKLLETATESTLREALESIQALRQKKPSPSLGRKKRFYILRKTRTGKFVGTDEAVQFEKSFQAKTTPTMTGSGGTGSTGPGKPKAKK